MDLDDRAGSRCQRRADAKPVMAGSAIGVRRTRAAEPLLHPAVTPSPPASPTSSPNTPAVSGHLLVRLVGAASTAVSDAAQRSHLVGAAQRVLRRGRSDLAAAALVAPDRGLDLLAHRRCRGLGCLVRVDPVAGRSAHRGTCTTGHARFHVRDLLGPAAAGVRCGPNARGTGRVRAFEEGSDPAPARAPRPLARPTAARDRQGIHSRRRSRAPRCRPEAGRSGRQGSLWPGYRHSALEGRSGCSRR